MSEGSVQKKIRISPEELKRLKLAKKEAKKKQNVQRHTEQEPTPKVLERQFVPIHDQVPLVDRISDLRVMTFNVGK